MDEVETLSLSTAVMMALGLIVNLLLLPFPFVWPYRVAKARRRFPERGKFCLLSGLISYALVALAMTRVVQSRASSVALADHSSAAGSTLPVAASIGCAVTSPVQPAGL